MTLVCGKEVTLPDTKNSLAVIDYVRDRLLEQKERSGTIGYCYFRWKHNDKMLACALGWLIPDSAGDKVSEQWKYLDSIGFGGDKDDGDKASLADDLREIHNEQPTEKWAELFVALRTKYEQAA